MLVFTWGLHVMHTQCNIFVLTEVPRPYFQAFFRMCFSLRRLLYVAKLVFSALETSTLQGSWSHLSAIRFGDSQMAPVHAACIKKGFR